MGEKGARVCPKCGGEITPKGQLTPNQKEAVRVWEAVTGCPLMHLDEVKSGEMTFYDAFEDNVRWLEGVLGTAMNAYKGEPNPCECGHEEKAK